MLRIGTARVADDSLGARPTLPGSPFGWNLRNGEDTLPGSAILGTKDKENQ
jgi:hypothetical protein